MIEIKECCNNCNLAGGPGCPLIEHKACWDYQKDSCTKWESKEEITSEEKQMKTDMLRIEAITDLVFKQGQDILKEVGGGTKFVNWFRGLDATKYYSALKAEKKKKLDGLILGETRYVNFQQIKNRVKESLEDYRKQTYGAGMKVEEMRIAAFFDWLLEEKK